MYVLLLEGCYALVLARVQVRVRVLSKVRSVLSHRPRTHAWARRG